ncbi:MAG: DNA polymerase/3'-5' exonuclease PolX [Spirochaetia bacterium]|jgi:DNA polymerase (family 10)
MDNNGIASALGEIAVFSELTGENPFKSRAYENVARIIEKYPESVAELCAQGRLREIKGVGKSIEDIIKDLVSTGRSSVLEGLKEKFPPRLLELLSLSGMGPKRVKAVYEKLGIASIGELEYACRENRLISLEGFGEKSQANILKAIEFRKTTQESRLFSDALQIADELVRDASESGLFSSVEVAGSLRRGKETFKDIDILLVPGTGATIQAIQEKLLAFADQGRDGPQVIGAGETKVSVRCRGLQVDFRIVPPESHPAALQHFTGSKDHNTLLRTRAKAMGMKMSEWGVFGEDGAPLALRDEADVYAKIGLGWIPPEIREGDAEIEAAETGRLPQLVSREDVLGMIHVHSSASDGVRTLEQLARKCIDLGYSWLCLSDHSRTAVYASGLSAERLLDQVREIRKLNEILAPFRVFAGVESDILPDGSLDYPDDVLAQLDFVIGSVHSTLTMEREAATQRLCTAIANPRLTILGHPTGRLLLTREGYPWDESRVLDALRDRGVALEHNCNPHRLDPNWDVLKRAAGRGVLISLGPDAHDIQGFDDMRYGIVMARKAWLTRKNVLNCLSAEEADAYFTARKRA